MRKLISGNFIMVLVTSACSVFSSPTPTSTATATITSSPTITSAPTNTITPTLTKTATPSPIPPTPTATPIEDIVAFKEYVVGRVKNLLAGDFNILEIQKVEIADNHLVIEVVTTWGSASFNGETAYFLSFDLANLLVNEIGQDALLLMTEGEGLSISYKSLSIHFNLEFRYEADFETLKRLASEEISIPDWVELTNGHFP